MDLVIRIQNPYLCTMAKRTIDSNKHLKDKEKRFEASFQNLHASFEVEGIKIPAEDAKRIAEEVRTELANPTKQKPRG
jgi:hypothetical protein